MKTLTFIMTLIISLFFATFPIVANSETVTLEWDAVTATDLKGYNVYFKNLTARQLDKLLTVGLITTTSVNIPTVDGAGEFVIVMKAFDQADNESIESDPAVDSSGNVVKWTDKTPPGPPKALRVNKPLEQQQTTK